MNHPVGQGGVDAVQACCSGGLIQQSRVEMTLNRRDLLMAYRWPAAVVLSCVVVSGVLLRVLHLTDSDQDRGFSAGGPPRAASPMSVDAASPLPVTVTGAVPLMNNQRLSIRGPLTVNGTVQA